MLSEKTIAIVKSTAPVLDEHGEALTRHFYKRMFSHNPEVQPLFNPANQFAGTQQRALAAAICAYAANIDNLEALGGAVELIAQKHASLRILPEHYPIVGENLLASIREVLGAAASDDIINAWAEAYGFLADILIAREAQIYQEQKSAPGGWQDFKSFTVIKKEKESDNITSFYLTPTDESAVPGFKPGQYITVRVPSPCGHTTMRNYSLSDKPGQPHLRISVKRETPPAADTPAGYVSNFLHDNIEQGMILEIAPPSGEFYLDHATQNADRPLVLMAAGIGVTPLLSMALSLQEYAPARKVIFIHACLHENVQPFRAVLDDMAKANKNFSVHYCYSEAAPKETQRRPDAHEGFVNGAFVQKLLPDMQADYYFCGPKPFMVNIYHDLLARGIPANQVHFEFFGPRQELEKAA